MLAGRSEELRVGSDWSSDVCSSDLRGKRCELSYPSLRIMHQFGGAKIEQLDLAVRRHQYVGGFQVAVNDQVPVRKLHGLAHLKEEPDSGLHRQLAIGAV